MVFTKQKTKQLNISLFIIILEKPYVAKCELKTEVLIITLKLLEKNQNVQNKAQKIENIASKHLVLGFLK